MSRVAYNSAAATNTPKIYVVTELGKVPSTGGRGGYSLGTKGYLYTEGKYSGADIHGYMGVIGFCSPHRMCVFGILVLHIDMPSYEGRHTNFILN